jgi:hypothetical protein
MENKGVCNDIDITTMLTLGKTTENEMNVQWQNGKDKSSTCS